VKSVCGRHTNVSSNRCLEEDCDTINIINMEVTKKRKEVDYELKDLIMEKHMDIILITR